MSFHVQRSAVFGLRPIYDHTIQPVQTFSVGRTRLYRSFQNLSFDFSTYGPLKLCTLAQYQIFWDLQALQGELFFRFIVPLIKCDAQTLIQVYILVFLIITWLCNVVAMGDFSGSEVDKLGIFFWIFGCGLPEFRRGWPGGKFVTSDISRYITNAYLIFCFP